MQTQKEKVRKFILLSCVGKRPLAVINPINSLLKKSSHKAEDVSVILFATKSTETLGEQCKNWLEKEYDGIEVEVLFFDKEKVAETVRNLTENREIIYFNTNPGLNFEVAMILMYLPDNTRLIYGDAENLYIWTLKDDVKNATKTELLDTGFETYNAFSEKKFYQKEGINEGLSENIKELLYECQISSHFEVEGKGISGGAVQDFIQKHLVWVTERHGFVNLLFDFQKQIKDGMSEEEKKQQSEHFLTMYRAITSLFDPLNFNLTIITNDWSITNRALLDGVGVIFIKKQNEEWKKKVKKWIKKETKIRPKSIFPRDLKDELGRTKSEEETPAGGSCLFVCLGDNVEPTLKAILSHDLETTCIFFDKNSARLSYLAQMVKRVLENRKIIFVPTDNKGSGIISYIVRNVSQIKRVDINITPGTKAHTTTLVQAARHIGKIDSLYSINNQLNRIQSLSNPSISFEVKNPTIEQLVGCQIAPLKKANDVPDYPVFLEVMKGLARGEIVPHKSILEIKKRKNEQPIFKKIKNSDADDQCLLYCMLDGNTYTFPKDFVDEDKVGIWWEVATAYALKKNLTEEIKWGVTWDWPTSKKVEKFFSEIDVVFMWKGSVCAVSCKTGAERGLKEATRLSIGSKAFRYIGRFTLPFVAIPFDRSKEKGFTGLIKDDVMYLTPSILIDKKKLVEAVENFAASKRTWMI